jgi:Zn-dependent oligopeptidase/predicted RNA-binding Zn-ribbon protein involved in translation (DUF1610 family)
MQVSSVYYYYNGSLKELQTEKINIGQFSISHKQQNNNSHLFFHHHHQQQTMMLKRNVCMSTNAVLRPTSATVVSTHFNCPQCSTGFTSHKKMTLHISKNHMKRSGGNGVGEENLCTSNDESHFRTTSTFSSAPTSLLFNKSSSPSSPTSPSRSSFLRVGSHHSSIKRTATSTTVTNGIFPLIFLKDNEAIREFVYCQLNKSDSILKYCVNSYPNNNNNTILQLFANNEASLMTMIYSLNAMSNLNDNSLIRRTCAELSRRVEGHRLDMLCDMELYRVFNNTANTSNLSDVQIRYLSKLKTDFERNGLLIENEQVRNQILDKKKQISNLAQQFNRNVVEDTSYLIFGEQELLGLSCDDLSKFQQVEQGYRVMCKPTDINVIEKHAIWDHVRRQAHIMNAQKCQNVNTEIFEQVVALRNEVAQMLGYKNHADYILKIRMAQSIDHVTHFLDTLLDQVKPLEQSDYEQLLSLKRIHCMETNQPFDGKVNAWDVQFLVQIQKSKLAQSEPVNVSEYFVFEDTIWKMFHLFGKLFSFSIRERTDEVADKLWHSDVRFFSVYDKPDGKLMGHFFLDAFPRAGKFQRSACFPLQSHCIVDESSNTEQVQVVCIVTNFRKSSSGDAMLEHRELITLLHEFGHCMHNMCTTSPFARFSGTNVEKDFAEFPSQLIQTWAWNRQALKYLSSHYKTNQCLPDAVIDSILASRTCGLGIETVGRIHLSKFDLYVHGSSSNNRLLNTAQVYSDLKSEMSMIPVPPDCNPAATFGHLMRNFDASFYAYLYSQVFSIDVYNVFCDKNAIVQNDEFASRYRSCILERGGTRDGMDMLEELLGRKPSLDAFVQFMNPQPL